MVVLGSADLFIKNWLHICKNSNMQFPSVDMSKFLVGHALNSYKELGTHLEWVLLPWLLVTNVHQQACIHSQDDSVEYLQWMDHEAICSTAGRPLRICCLMQADVEGNSLYITLMMFCMINNEAKLIKTLNITWRYGFEKALFNINNDLIINFFFSKVAQEIVSTFSPFDESKNLSRCSVFLFFPVWTTI